MSRLAKICLIIALSVTSTIASAWLFYLYWGWFIAPATGHVLSYRHAVGIDLTIGIELSGVVYILVNRKEDLDDLYIGYLLMLVAQLVLGFLWHLVLQ